MNAILSESSIIDALKTVFDPDIPVNIYDLGLIYDINIIDNQHVSVTMTLTNPNCPVADELVKQAKEAVEQVQGVSGANIRLVFDPPWSKDNMSDAAMLELGLL
jgi:FeS assembly SUF system protein